MQFLIGQCTMKIMLTTTRAMCKLQIVIRTVRRLGGSRRSKWIIATIFVLVVTVISLTVTVALLRNQYHQAAGTDKTPKLLVCIYHFETIGPKRRHNMVSAVEFRFACQISF